MRTWWTTPSIHTIASWPTPGMDWQKAKWLMASGSDSTVATRVVGLVKRISHEFQVGCLPMTPSCKTKTRLVLIVPGHQPNADLTHVLCDKSNSYKIISNKIMPNFLSKLPQKLTLQKKSEVMNCALNLFLEKGLG